MNKLSLKRKIDIAFFLVLIVFISLFYSTYNRASTVTRNRQIIQETYASNAVLEKILSSAIDIETGSRGYTLTGQDNFLRVYDSGHIKVTTWLDSLLKMKNAEATNLPKIDTLRDLIREKTDFSTRVIDARKTEGMESAANLIATGRGKQIMDSIRIHIQALQKAQLEVLTAKLAETDVNIKARNINFAFFAIASFLIIVFAYTKVRGTSKQIVRDGIIQSQLADELTFQNRQLNDFANHASHNLRSSASNMSSLIEIIDEKSTLDDFKMVFEMLKKVSRNLTESLNELIEILRIRKSQAIEKELIRFEDICNKVSETLQGDIITKNVTIEADFSKAPEVLFSKVYLESAMQNLMSNAIKYRSPERNPMIWITTSIYHGHTVLEIRDNGLGIDLERHGDKVFGMYQMFHKHPEAKGIGLFITKAQIENFGGKISVASDGKSGTTFTVRFGK